MPAFLKRSPRNLNIDSWKASEWRTWVLNYSVPILSSIFKQQRAKYLQHWCRFVNICYLVSLKEIDELSMASLRISITCFLREFEGLYGTIAATQIVGIPSY